MMFSSILFSVIAFSTFFLRWLMSRRSNSLGSLLGKTAIVTGGASGLGYGTCLLLASRGCRIIIADCVNAEPTVKKVVRKTGNPNISYKFLDLSSLENVREFAREIMETETKIDILINNAGVAGQSKIRSIDGLNSVMQINYFGPFLLTRLLMKLLKASPDSRVIFTGSVTIYFFNLDLEKFNSTENHSTLEKFRCYSISKLCNVMAAQEFAKRTKNSNVTFYSIDPTFVKSDLFRNKYNVAWYRIGFKLIHLCFYCFGQEPTTSAQTTLDLVTREEIQNESGRHYACVLPWFKPKQLSDQKMCDQVWKLTEELVQLLPYEVLNEW